MTLTVPLTIVAAWLSAQPAPRHTGPDEHVTLPLTAWSTLVDSATPPRDESRPPQPVVHAERTIVGAFDKGLLEATLEARFEGYDDQGYLQAGRLLLPLKRSAGTASSLTPIEVQLVYEEHQPSFGWIGSHELTLPALELPVAVVQWRVYLPADHRYGAFAGDVGEYYTEGRWSQAVATDDGGADGGAGDLDGPAFDEGATSVETAEAGAMPVRITLPTAGVEVVYSRFWVPTDEPVMTGFRYVADWVPAAGELLAGLLLALGAWLVAGRRRDLPSLLLRGGGAALVVAGGAGVVLIGSAHKLIPYLLLALVAVMLRRKIVPAAWRGLREWAARVPQRYREREARLDRTPQWRGIGRAVLLVALLLVGVALLDDALQIVVAVVEG